MTDRANQPHRQNDDTSDQQGNANDNELEIINDESRRFLQPRAYNIVLPTAEQIESSLTIDQLAQLFGTPGVIFEFEFRHFLQRKRVINRQDFQRLGVEKENLRVSEQIVKNDPSHRAREISKVLSLRRRVSEQEKQNRDAHRAALENLDRIISTLLEECGTSQVLVPDVAQSLKLFAAREYQKDQFRELLVESRNEFVAVFNEVLEHFQVGGMFERPRKDPFMNGMDMPENQRLQPYYEGFIWREADLRKHLEKIVLLNIGAQQAREIVTNYFQQNRLLRDRLHEFYLEAVELPNFESRADVYRTGHRFRPILKDIDFWLRSAIRSAENGQEIARPPPETRIPLAEA